MNSLDWHQFFIDNFALIMLGMSLLFLILLATFFSLAETALMAVNRYRLRHKADLKKSYAMLILRMLKRPDKLLGIILIGNNFANILASSLATLIAIHFWGEKGALIASVILTFVIIIFAEVAPKTYAALYPETISKFVAFPIYGLLKVLYPLVWMVNYASNGVLRLFGVDVTASSIEPLTREELRSVVYETAGRFSRDYQSMLLSILDLHKINVEDVMIPRHEIFGIDITLNWEQIEREIAQSPYDWLPIFEDNINQIVGVLHLREFLHRRMMGAEINKDSLREMLHEPYFVPEGTPLNIQLLNFQREKKRVAFIVDEYGQIQGLSTLVDILEEIVGEFTTSVSVTSKVMEKQADGSYLVDGAITIRELNRVSRWKLPTEEARTLNGLITEYLETIPKPGICVMIENHPIEIIKVIENRVKIARVWGKYKLINN